MAVPTAYHMVLCRGDYQSPALCRATLNRWGRNKVCPNGNRELTVILKYTRIEVTSYAS